MGRGHPPQDRDDVPEETAGEGSTRDPSRPGGMPGGEHPPSDYPGRELLSGSSPREILERLLQGDPLELEGRCRGRIESLAVLVDLGRVHLRALARIAHAAQRWQGTPSLSEFLAERIDYSVRELIQEDREEESSGIPPAEPWDGRYAFLSESLGIQPALARRACLAFNRLPDRVRCAYFAVLVLGKTVNRYVAEGHGPPEQVKADIEMAVKTISDAIGRQSGGPEGSHA